VLQSVVKRVIKSTTKLKLHTVFSKYIRLRDTDYNYEGFCITCGKETHYNASDAGHWIHRDWIGTTFHEKNVHLQCRECNRYKAGNELIYEVVLELRYGPDILKELNRLKMEVDKIPRTKLEDLYEYYTKMNKQLTRIKELGQLTPEYLLGYDAESFE